MHFSYERPTNQVSDSAFGTVVRKTRSCNDDFCIKRGLVYSCYLRIKKKKSHNMNTKPFIKKGESCPTKSFGHCGDAVISSRDGGPEGHGARSRAMMCHVNPQQFFPMRNV